MRSIPTEPNPEFPDHPDDPGTPTDTDTLPYPSDIDIVADGPEYNCLRRQGFPHGATVRRKIFKSNYFTLHATSGGRILVEVHVAELILRIGTDNTGKVLLTQTIHLHYTAYNPWRWSPVFEFIVSDSDGKRVIKHPARTIIGGACPSITQDKWECESVFYNDLDPLVAFDLAARCRLSVSKSQFIYC